MRFLFDRLCSPAKNGRPQGYSSLRDLRLAIEKELGRILSQKSYFYGLDSDQGSFPDSVLNYGLKSITDVDVNHESLTAYASEVQRAIALYEPRLKDCQVRISEDDNRYGKQVFLISGKIDFDHQSYGFGVSVPMTG
ncbi:MAG: type VI secretion system baseplate subunit TssE [Gammaproteobacteria bacterium]|nr:type VI secretion system baseplate subunit TssE [Gammaproteobacteria bacterium]|tara:strand:+ start:198 stop:608 length:411 start_codon:yes stop_codon:yes gene_type:complete